MSEVELQVLLLRALNTVSGSMFEDLDLDASVEDLGLDSLGLTEMILFLEDHTGAEIPEAVLDQLAGVDSVRRFHEVLAGHFVGEPA